MKRTIKVRCKFDGEESVVSIFEKSFYLYLKRILEEKSGYSA